MHPFHAIQRRGLAIASLLGLLALPASGVLAQGTPVTITFDDAVRLALKQNVAVRQAENAVATSTATVRQRSAAFLRRSP